MADKNQQTFKQIREYEKGKGRNLTSAERGFLVRNRIEGKTVEEIDALITTATRKKEVLLGEGDKFKAWCERMNRPVPNDDLVERMNADPYAAGQEVRKDIPNNPALWRAYVSYHSGRGRNRVR